MSSLYVQLWVLLLAAFVLGSATAYLIHRSTHR